jgi:hypothetical protein
MLVAIRTRISALRPKRAYRMLPVLVGDVCASVLRVVGEGRGVPEAAYDECRRGAGSLPPGAKWRLSCAHEVFARLAHIGSIKTFSDSLSLCAGEKLVELGSRVFFAIKVERCCVCNDIKKIRGAILQDYYLGLFWGIQSNIAILSRKLPQRVVSYGHRVPPFRASSPLPKFAPIAFPSRRNPTVSRCKTILL